jgi:glycosyltransferase involved in cell wall biosynthesis
MRLSVVICTYNRIKWIKYALESSCNQTLNKDDYEVLVINNNCTDGTGELVDEFINSHPEYNVRQVLETQQGLSYARNRGIKEASSDVITYIDDDAIAKPDFFEKVINYMESHSEVIGIGGKVTPKYEGEEPKWLNKYLNMMVTRVNHGEESFKCQGKLYPAGCNMTYRKNVLEEIGGFNEKLKWRVDDKYIFMEAQKVSDEIYYIPDLEVEHNIDEERTSDDNFKSLSMKLGHEERIRVKSLSAMSFTVKIIEYFVKYLASILLGLSYAAKGKWIKGRYIIKFRWYAFLGLINLKSY